MYGNIINLLFLFQLKLHIATLDYDRLILPKNLSAEHVIKWT